MKTKLNIIFFCFLIAFSLNRAFACRISNIITNSMNDAIINEFIQIDTLSGENKYLIKAASEQIDYLIQEIPENELIKYGFNSLDELGKISFDKPIKVYRLSDDKIEFTLTWRIPIVVQNEYRALLTVVKENDKYRAVQLGATQLAEMLYGTKHITSLGLLRVYELKRDFIIDATDGVEKDQLRFIMIDKCKAKSYNIDEIFQLINNTY